MMRTHATSGGYIYLLTVLVVGVIASTVTFSFLILATSSARTSIAVQRSATTMAVAQACAEYAVRELFKDPTYTGNEVRDYGDGQCEILGVVGSGNENRSICVDATSGTVTRRIEILIKQLLPQVQVFSWQEVSIITVCSY